MNTPQPPIEPPTTFQDRQAEIEAENDRKANEADDWVSDMPDEHSPLFSWFADYVRKYNRHLRGM